MEIWADVSGFENYAVSTQGRVKNKRTELFLSPRPAGKGYLSVCLGAGNYRYIHRLVAQAFIPNPEGLPQVNHLDAKKTNNAVSNLEWVSPNGNMQHAFDHGLLTRTACCNPKSGEENTKSHSVSMLADGGMLVVHFESIRQASKLTNIDYSTIHGAVSGRFSSAGGCIWQRNEA